MGRATPCAAAAAKAGDPVGRSRCNQCQTSRESTPSWGRHHRIPHRSATSKCWCTCWSHRCRQDQLGSRPADGLGSGGLPACRSLRSAAVGSAPRPCELHSRRNLCQTSREYMRSQCRRRRSHRRRERSKCRCRWSPLARAAPPGGAPGGSLGPCFAGKTRTALVASSVSAVPSLGNSVHNEKNFVFGQFVLMVKFHLKMMFSEEFRLLVSQQ